MAPNTRPAQLVDLAYPHLCNSGLKRLRHILAERHLAAVRTHHARTNVDHCQQLVKVRVEATCRELSEFEQFAHWERICVLATPSFTGEG